MNTLTLTEALPPPQLFQHPDYRLLVLCGHLRMLQDEWQRLWEATEGTPDGGPADQAFDTYVDTVWPGEEGSEPGTSLTTTVATTPEGIKAKAAAILALEAAANLAGGRTDTYEMAMNLLQDVAGPGYVEPGQAAQDKREKAQ